MGIYNPTNTRCQIMSYVDKDAPQYLMGSRTSFLEFLDKVLTVGYNTQSVISAVSTTLEDEEVIELGYAEEHGYIVGQLIKISGATTPELNDIFRVVASSEDLKKVYIGNFASGFVPPSSISGSLVTKVAPLDWEIVYSEQNRRSYRSKMQNSSKNVLTLRYPRIPSYATNPSHAVFHELSVSKDIDLSTGDLIDSYTDSSEYVQSDTKIKYGAYYFAQQTTSFNNIFSGITPGNTSRTPWYLIGDGRIFYLYYSVGHHTNPSEGSEYVNYNRDPNVRYTNRYSFAFGDPNCFDENDVYLGSGTILNCIHLNNNLTGYASHSDPRLGGIYNSYLAFTQTYDGMYHMSISDIHSLGTYSPSNFSASHNHNFPNLATKGFLVTPYLINNHGNTEPFYRAELPYLRYSHQNINSVFNASRRHLFDWVPFKLNDGGVLINIANYDYHGNPYNSYCISIGY